MNLDFSGLDQIAQKKRPHSKPQESFSPLEEYESAPGDKRPENGLKTAVEGTQQLQREADQKRDALQHAAGVYKRYQENIKATETLQAEILKGVAAGVDTETLFLKAAKALSLTISNDLFYNQIERAIQHRKSTTETATPATQETLEP